MPDVAIVLGSGLGDFANRLNDAAVDSVRRAAALAGVEGDRPRRAAGRSARSAAKRVAALSGRAHFYEGHDLRTVTFATRVIGRLGVKALILTNAAGGINVDAEARHADGDGRSHQPARQQPARRAERRRVRRAVSRHERGLLEAPARAGRRRSRARRGCAIGHGVYVAVHGPSYETPAEIRFFRDASAPTRSACPRCPRRSSRATWASRCSASRASPTPPPACCRSRSNHDEVMEVARQVRGAFAALLEGIIGRALTTRLDRRSPQRQRRAPRDRRSGADRRLPTRAAPRATAARSGAARRRAPCRQIAATRPPGSRSRSRSPPPATTTTRRWSPRPSTRASTRARASRASRSAPRSKPRPARSSPAATSRTPPTA